LGRLSPPRGKAVPIVPIPQPPNTPRGGRDRVYHATLDREDQLPCSAPRLPRGKSPGNNRTGMPGLIGSRCNRSRERHYDMVERSPRHNSYKTEVARSRPVPPVITKVSERACALRETATGQAAAPPRSVMKLRRLMSFPLWATTTPYHIVA
jgi:hypothetical protein